MRWKDLRVRTKLTLSFLLLLILIIGMVGWTAGEMARVEDQASLIRTDGLKYGAIAQQMRVDVIQIQQWLTDISATRGLDGLNDGFDEAQKSLDSCLEGLSAFDRRSLGENDESQLRLLTDLRSRVVAYHSMGKAMAEAYVSGGPATGNLLMADFDTAAESLDEVLTPFIAQQVASADNAVDAVVALTRRLSSGLWGALALAVVSTLLILLVLQRSITLPLSRILGALREIARGSGDLTLRLETTGGDEIGQTAEEFNTFAGRVEDLVVGIRQSVVQIDGAAGSIDQGCSQLATRTETQASSLELAATSLEQMTSAVKANAEHAHQAAELAQGTQGRADQGNRTVKQAMEAMERLGAASKKVIEVITVMDELAFQTNLLALNAAVEAARAGEEGRSFAVVAEEVGSLAQRSTSAAHEAKALINEAVERAEEGARLVGGSSEDLGKIQSSIQELSELVSGIATANREQSSGIEQVNQTVRKLETVTQQNVAMVEETAGSSRSLSIQSTELASLISQYKVCSEPETIRSGSLKKSRSQ